MAVGTSTTNMATSYPCQRKSFYAAGRFWVFYGNGTYMVYCTSTDGATWSSATTVKTGGAGFYFDVYFDGTYVHYAFADGGAGHDLIYRRGTPNSDGTITWSAEQIAYDAVYVKNVQQEYLNYPSVTTDSNGYPFISFTYYESVNAVRLTYITKSSTNDGTWATASGFPMELSNVYTYISAVVRMTSGKVYAVWDTSISTLSQGPLKGKLWDGTSLGSEETVSIGNVQTLGYFSALAIGDVVHVFYLNSYYNLRWCKRDDTWTDSALTAATTSTTAPVVSADGNNLYMFYAGYPTANHIYYRKYDGSNWGTAVDLIDESTEVLTGNDKLTCYYNKYGNYIGLVYMTKTASPYNVKFAYLSLAAPPSAALRMVGDGLTLVIY